MPYSGRAYTAPINPDDAGYDFTSSKSDYKIEPKKKGSYQISIKTKDNNTPVEFMLTVYSNKKAYLQVNSTNKQVISYSGYVK